ncbi:MAG TPA: LacI family DNA-binding transcriptional regulator [Chthonomonadales bacterium]|nr:LacI family DNA-binding transcriptional regulator [Chthonomonadales bacterium]
MATIRDISSMLHLSPATVSRALHDPESPFVSARTRQRVQEAALSLGYVPDMRGRALVTGSSQLVSLWINDPYTAYYAMVGGHLYAESVRRGYHPVIRGFHTPAEGAAAWQAPDSLADGILALDVRDPLLRCIDAFPRLPKPIVSLGALCVETVDHVRVDLKLGATEAVQHLVETRTGRTVGWLYREDDPRTNAYREVMASAGRQPEVVFIPDETRRTNRALVTSYIRERGCPGAFFCQNDEVAIAVYRGALDAGLRVPEDVAIVGCDGIEDGEYLPTPLSTIVHPVDEMCRIAWEFMANRLKDPERPQQSAELPARLLVRASSGPAGQGTFDQTGEEVMGPAPVSV